MMHLFLYYFYLVWLHDRQVLEEVMEGHDCCWTCELDLGSQEATLSSDLEIFCPLLPQLSLISREALREQWVETLETECVAEPS